MEHDGSVKHVCCTDGEVSAREAAAYVLLCLSANLNLHINVMLDLELDCLTYLRYVQCVAIYDFTGSCHHLKCTRHVHESAVIMQHCPVVLHLAFTTVYFCVFVFSINPIPSDDELNIFCRVKNEKQNMIK